MAYQGNPVRLLVIPGLQDSGSAHWQTWLEANYRHAVRVQQEVWDVADLDRWAHRIQTTVSCYPGVRWVAVAHSFGCLALVRHLAQGGTGVKAALLVAPADPEKFAVADRLTHQPLGIPSVLVGSETDPWMRIESARSWARVWQSQFINMGDVGHINAESGFGPLPLAKTLVQLMVHRLERDRRLERAHPLELSFAT